ncbi:hypothetical protein EX30DRAFT_375055 [Ascodesmis nigricans]|uniref:C2H2-type domain-containing protein n=1 Tax=Ascodesmis nigricans TaxID=341454 RepID=A0A4S2MNX7_9PEZI|nr:hypothetical protein EX30DRAFT_375055 [Ascodesmis nigricans]
MHTCNTCLCEFADRRALRRHLRTAHIDDDDEEDNESPPPANPPTSLKVIGAVGVSLSNKRAENDYVDDEDMMVQSRRSTAENARGRGRKNDSKNTRQDVPMLSTEPMTKKENINPRNVNLNLGPAWTSVGKMDENLISFGSSNDAENNSFSSNDRTRTPSRGRIGGRKYTTSPNGSPRTTPWPEAISHSRQPSNDSTERVRPGHHSPSHESWNQYSLGRALRHGRGAQVDEDDIVSHDARALKYKFSSGTKRNVLPPPVLSSPTIVHNPASDHFYRSSSLPSPILTDASSDNICLSIDIDDHTAPVKTSSPTSRTGSNLQDNDQLPTPFATPSPPPAQIQVIRSGTSRNHEIMEWTSAAEEEVVEIPLEEQSEGSDVDMLSSKYREFRWLESTGEPFLMAGTLVMPVPPSDATCGMLEQLLVSRRVLQSKGYFVQPSRGEVDGRKRCVTCHVEKRKIVDRDVNNKPIPCFGHPGEDDTTSKEHLRWSCCNAVLNEGQWCTSIPTHNFEHTIAQHRTLISPPPNPSPLFAIALDCEMATATDGTRILIQLSVTDFFSGKKLINRLVKPSKPIASYHTPFSGIDAPRMKAAIASNKAFHNVMEAQQRLLNFIGPNTIIIGHSAQFDLDIMGITHDRVIDTYISIPRGAGYQRHGLKELCLKYVKTTVQENNHDCLEDAYAVRALLQAVMLDTPMFNAMITRKQMLDGCGGVEEGDRLRKERNEKKDKVRMGSWQELKVEQTREWREPGAQYLDQHQHHQQMAIEFNPYHLQQEYSPQMHQMHMSSSPPIDYHQYHPQQQQQQYYAGNVQAQYNMCQPQQEYMYQYSPPHQHQQQYHQDTQYYPAQYPASSPFQEYQFPAQV